MIIVLITINVILCILIITVVLCLKDDLIISSEKLNTTMVKNISDIFTTIKVIRSSDDTILKKLIEHIEEYKKETIHIYEKLDIIIDKLNTTDKCVNLSRKEMNDIYNNINTLQNKILNNSCKCNNHNTDYSKYKKTKIADKAKKHTNNDINSPLA